MGNGADAHIDLAELQRLLEAVEPGVVLVSPRLLRRVIKRHCRIPGFGLRVPHRKTYVIDRETLFGLVDEADLQLTPGRRLPTMVILLGKPDPERLATQSREDVLVKYWRLLLHARVHVALDERHKDGRLDAIAIRARIHRIGETEFDEVRGVLKQEDFLLPPGDDRQAYVEFVALYLDLSSFAPTLLIRYFPALRDRRDVQEIVALDIDNSALLAQTRPQGAPDPATIATRDTSARTRKPEDEDGSVRNGTPSPGAYRRLMARANRARARGNCVRAAILLRRAVSVAAAESARDTLMSAHAELIRLAERLHKALGLSEDTAAEWQHALPALLEHAAHGIWPPEARLLYDLQKVCTEYERETYALDVVGWIVSAGKLPVKRLLPNHRAVLIAKHVRSAMRRVFSLRVPERSRRALARLLHDAVQQSEQALRNRLRPLIVESFERVPLEAQNYPEEVARKKLVEELIDLAVERGFVTVGDLRDAVARNNVKLPDLANTDEFFLGDRLIRTNRRLAVAWDGVYHRGEIYLRWLQRLSSLAFATRPGRFLTRYLILPYGVAYLSLEGFLHLQHLFARLTGSGRIHLDPRETAFSVVVFGTFLLALLHSARFRSSLLKGLRVVGRMVRAIAVDAPVYVMSLPFVRRMLDSDGFAVFRNLVLKPLGVTAVTAAVYPLYNARLHTALAGMGATFVAACLVLNTRAGHIVEESITDALMRTWLRFRLDVFPALFAFVMGLFHGLVEAVERVIYTVDEWLRFRTGQSRFTLAAKTVLGFFWFFVTYVVRIYVNLFIEPTVNPIKHFPVVTVSAKLILPFYRDLLPLLEAPFLPLGPAFAKSMALLNFALLPGIFGFIVWELKENWRLYRANRPTTLRPVIIGHHGETMSRLLRPGFHSGTVPNLYGRLRRAERRAYRSGRHAAAHRYREALHHIEERIRNFVERDFLELLRGSRSWGQTPISAGQISISSNRILVEFCSPLDANEPLRIAFAERTGWLVASHRNPGWLTRLSPGQLNAWNLAVAGLYKLASVDVVREQVESNFPDDVWVDLRPEGLVIWPSSRPEVQALYPLHDHSVRVPRVEGPGEWPALPALDGSKVLFSRTPILWSRWVETWQADHAGEGIPPDALAQVAILPRQIDAAPIHQERENIPQQL